MNPAIIIIAYNRPIATKRLLSSITKAIYPTTDIPLYLCIDYTDSRENREVYQIAIDFDWKYGEKIIIQQPTNLGLKAHVLTSCDLVINQEAIIVLEDDLYVSPYFYAYASAALDFYKDEPDIAGISLYDYNLVEHNFLPFVPLLDKNDVYFLQFAASWGQAFTKKQWNIFRNWLTIHPTIDTDLLFPEYVLGWPESSWKKQFIHYLIKEDKYFVYPRGSYTTNFNDTGVHSQEMTPFFQVPLQMNPKQWCFGKIASSKSVYDAFFEVNPAIIKYYTPHLKDYDIEVDLYGLKNLEKIKSKFLLTSKTGTSPVRTYGLLLKPMELNIVEDIDGNHLRLEQKDTLLNKSYRKYQQQIYKLDYFYGLFPHRKYYHLFLKLVYFLWRKKK